MVLAAIAISAGKARGQLSEADETRLVHGLVESPRLMAEARGAAEATMESRVTMVLPDMAATFTPMVYAVPVQLLAYHTAVVMGTDVDQPRNLAKSVTVE